MVKRTTVRNVPMRRRSVKDVLIIRSAFSSFFSPLAMVASVVPPVLQRLANPLMNVISGKHTPSPVIA